MDYRYKASNVFNNRNRLHDAHFGLKDWKNMSTHVSVDNYTMFTNNQNISKISARIRRLREEKESANTDSISITMRNWAIVKKINISFAPAYYMDSASCIELMNNQFIKENRHLYRGRDMNIFGKGASVLDYSAGVPILVKKKYKDFMPNDIRNMDVWQPIHIGTQDSKQRYNNRIPSWQRTMNIRNIDRDPSTYNVNLADRESIEQPTRGFDMSRILKGSFY